MRPLSVLAGAALLAGSLAACDEKEDTPDPTSSQSQEEAPKTEPSEEPGEEQDADSGAQAEGEGNAEPSESPGAERVDQEGEDGPSGWNGEGEDPATMQDEDPQHDPNAVIVGYETLPGNCDNDVPLPESKHGVVSTEDLADGECLVVIDSRGDSLFMAKDIASQFETLGFRQTSVSPEDDSETALNTASYLTNTHEVHVTVQQDGISGVIITYALTKKLRGNG